MFTFIFLYLQQLADYGGLLFLYLFLLCKLLCFTNFTLI